MTRVLLLYERFIPSVRLCAYEQLKFLSKERVFDFYHCQTNHVTKKQCEDADVVIFVRAVTELDLVLAGRFKKANKYIIYVLDDDLLNIDDELISTQYYKMAVVQKRIRKMLKLCDVLVSPSRYLLNKYKDDVKRIVKIEEPCLAIRKIDQGVGEGGDIKSNKIKIGFAGSPDRNRDINEILESVIIKLYNKYGKIIDVEFFGAKPSVVEKMNLNYHPYEESYDEYQEKLSALNWDIGLAPMDDTEFKRCKYYNKYMEYGSKQCIGVYSRVIPYTEAIIDGYNGLLCDNTEDEWLLKLEKLIEDEELRLGIRDNIEKEMAKEFSLEKVARNYLRDISELECYKAPRCRFIMFTYDRIYARITRALEFVMRNKWSTPRRLMDKLLEAKGR